MSCVTIGNLPNISVLLLPLLDTGDGTTFRESLGGLKILIYINSFVSGIC